jgi:hypothetical protein
VVFAVPCSILNLRNLYAASNFQGHGNTAAFVFEPQQARKHQGGKRHINQQDSCTPSACERLALKNGRMEARERCRQQDDDTM